MNYLDAFYKFMRMNVKNQSINDANLTRKQCYLYLWIVVQQSARDIKLTHENYPTLQNVNMMMLRTLNMTKFIDCVHNYQHTAK